jgi:hypothetical protein
VSAEDLRAANLTIEPSWWEDVRGMAVSAGRLHIVRRDRSAALDIDPKTLHAQAAPPRTTPPRLSPPGQAEAMAAGFVTSDGAWLGLHTPEDRAGAYRAGRFVRRVENASDANTERFLTRAVLDPTADRSRWRIRSAAPVGDTPYLNAGFLRINASAEPLRLDRPAGALMIHTHAPARSGMLLVSRVDERGLLLWTAETGLDRFTLRQILPGESVSAFVGAAPSQPGRMSEPLVVFVAHDTGAVTSHALRR